MPTIQLNTSKLDAYKICSQCQGMGQYRTFLDMGHGCAREMMKSCDCNGGIVLKNPNIDPEKGEPPAEPASTSSARKGDGQEAQPVHRIALLEATSEDEEDGWVEAEIELPLVESSSEIDAQIVHMRFLELEVPD